MKLLTSTAIAVLLLGAPVAQAADIFNGPGSLKDDSGVPGTAVNWTGFYFGGQVGWSNSNHNLRGADTIDLGKCTAALASGDKVASYNHNAADCLKTAGQVWTPDIHTDKSDSIDGANSSGVFGGGTIGGDLMRGRYVFGVFGDYNFSGADFKSNHSEFGPDGKLIEGHSGSQSIEDGDSWIVAARAGYLFGEDKRALLYVLGGYGQADATFTGFTSDKDGKPTKKDVTFSGFVAGAGGEYALTRNIFLGIEWQHFFGSEEALFSEDGNVDGPRSNATNSKLTDDMSSDKVMAKLKLKLNGVLPSIDY